jgi:hypothetical protein
MSDGEAQDADAAAGEVASPTLESLSARIDALEVAAKTSDARSTKFAGGMREIVKKCRADIDDIKANADKRAVDAVKAYTRKHEEKKRESKKAKKQQAESKDDAGAASSRMPKKTEDERKKEVKRKKAEDAPAPKKAKKKAEAGEEAEDQPAPKKSKKKKASDEEGGAEQSTRKKPEPPHCKKCGERIKGHKKDACDDIVAKKAAAKAAVDEDEDA